MGTLKYYNWKGKDYTIYQLAEKKNVYYTTMKLWINEFGIDKAMELTKNPGIKRDREVTVDPIEELLRRKW